MESPEVLAGVVQQYLKEKLRKAYTYMKHDEVDTIAEQCGRNFEVMVEAQFPSLQARHARSNLMTLPPELRNRIYEYVLVADDGIECPDGSHMIEIANRSSELDWEEYEFGFPFYYSTKKWCAQPPLTKVSRQLRAETLPIYYGMNAFVVYVEGCSDFLSLDESDWWFDTMPAQSHRLVKNLQVRFCPNAAEKGLPRDRMAAILQLFGYDVRKATVTTWITLNGPMSRNFEDWKPVPDTCDHETTCRYEDTEAAFKNAVQSAAYCSKVAQSFDWLTVPPMPIHAREKDASTRYRDEDATSSG